MMDLGETGRELSRSRRGSEKLSGKRTRYRTKLWKAMTHDEAKSALEDVINSSDADSDSKQKASEGLEKLTKNITDESDIENLITAKLGGKCLVSLGESASVTVEKGYLTDEALTQIVDIVTAKSGLPSSKVTVVEAK